MWRAHWGSTTWGPGPRDSVCVCVCVHVQRGRHRLAGEPGHHRPELGHSTTTRASGYLILQTIEGQLSWCLCVCEWPCLPIDSSNTSASSHVVRTPHCCPLTAASADTTLAPTFFSGLSSERFLNLAASLALIPPPPPPSPSPACTLSDSMSIVWSVQ